MSTRDYPAAKAAGERGKEVAVVAYQQGFADGHLLATQNGQLDLLIKQMGVVVREKDGERIGSLYVEGHAIPILPCGCLNGCGCIAMIVSRESRPCFSCISGHKGFPTE